TAIHIGRGRAPRARQRRTTASSWRPCAERARSRGARSTANRSPPRLVSDNPLGMSPATDDRAGHMAIRARYAAPRTPWAALRVQTGDRVLPTTLTGPARLVALYQWRRGAAGA